LVSELPDDGVVVPKHGAVIKFYTVVYVCVHVVGIVNENKSN